MEYVEGKTLQDLLEAVQKRQVYLNSEHVSQLCFKLLKAVDFIQQAGILHRDIKPANLVVTPDFGIKILDFGLARTIVNNLEAQIKNIPTSSSERKQIGKLLADERKVRKQCKRSLSPRVITRVYRPPEVALTEEYSFSADIWSVGCVIAEILKC
mmetsp:Transcript_19366/g.29698  ORF Transcript_19366/g.29698 Transcript_19366/m.29698 type:complete len:155 (-) Transcript_19366:619-1083(-)